MLYFDNFTSNFFLPASPCTEFFFIIFYSTLSFIEYFALVLNFTLFYDVCCFHFSFSNFENAVEALKFKGTNFRGLPKFYRFVGT